MSEIQGVLGTGKVQERAIRPNFNKSIFIDFAGAKITRTLKIPGGSRSEQGQKTSRKVFFSE